LGIYRVGSFVTVEMWAVNLRKYPLNSIIKVMQHRIYKLMGNIKCVDLKKVGLAAFFLIFTGCWSAELRAEISPTVQSIPSEVLIPKIERTKLLSNLPTSKQIRSESTYQSVSTTLVDDLESKIENITIEIGGKDVKSKSRDDKKVARVELYLEALSWSGGRKDFVKSAIANASDIISTKSGKKNGLALLVSSLLEGLYAGDKTAIDKLEVILNKKRTDPIAGEINLLIADYRLSQQDFKGARPYLLAALGHRELRRKAYANLKLAWTLFEADQTIEGIATIKSLLSQVPSPVKNHKANRTKNKSKEQDVFRSACIELAIRMYAELGNLESGHAALQALGFKEQIPGLYLEFGKTNITKESTAKSGIAGLVYYVKFYSELAQAEYASLLVLDAHLKYGQLVESEKSARSLLESLKDARTSNDLKNSVLRLAESCFLEALAKKDPAHFKLAHSFFAMAEKFSLDEGEQNRTIWARAELAHQEGESSEAARQFLLLGNKPEKDFFIINQQNGKKFNPHRITLENAVALAKGSQPGIFKQACKKLVDIYDGRSKYIRFCDMDLPKIFLSEKDFASGKGALDRKITIYHDLPDSLESMKLVFGIVQKDGSEQLALAKKYLAIRAYADNPATKSYLSTLQFDAELKQINDIASAGVRISKLIELVQQFPADPRGVAILLSASKTADSLKFFDLAGDGLKLLLKIYPDSREAEEATFLAADLNERKFALDQAASLYQLYDRKFGALGARSIIAKQKVCEFSIILELAQALDACRGLSTRDKLSAKSAIERLIAKAFYEGRVDYLQVLVDANYIKFFELSPNEKIIALYKLYVANQRNGSAAVKAASEIKSIYSKGPTQVSGEALKFVSELYYRDILFTKAIYDNLNLSKTDGRLDNLIKAIEEKKRGLDNLQFQLTKIVQIGSPNWASASYYQIAQAHEVFASMLRNPPLIEGIKPVDVKRRLAPQAASLEDAALRLYEKALSISWKFRIYNEFAVKAVDGQARLSGSPVRFKDWIESPLLFNLDPTGDGMTQGSKNENKKN